MKFPPWWGYGYFLELHNRGWAAKLGMAEATEITACSIDNMTYTQVPVVCEKKKFHLFHLSQPVRGYS